ncbi:MAG: Flp pilus assembly complex ATPase component TadA [Candidatus Aenigmarchaeota archaeon]|nr:Flp pilus assembly complex ATPase component TadA [Candidatus Aenigmarchaeota archaeon]
MKIENIENKTNNKKIVPDTSVLIAGVLSDLVQKGELKEAEIIIPEFVVEELRAQASKGREIGFKGLEEIKKIRAFEKDLITITKTGRRQTYEEIQLAKYGRIDALIMDVAREQNAIIYTADYVQALVSEAEGIPTRYFKSYEKKVTTKLEEMLTKDTMSLHMKEGTYAMAKKGKPGNFELAKVGDHLLTAEELEEIIKEIMEAARNEDDSFVEVGGHSASVVQHGNVRIAIARPPFSDGIEVTAVRPVAKLTIDDYSLSEKLKERINKGCEGIVVAGPPGSGKSTFAASIAEFYEKKGKIVKTMESPRDLQVGPEITQYTKLKGKFENTADMLLLVRPDYTVFDEVRKTEDFTVFADMRLAGIGMIGVVHASEPVDAVQRFMGRVELGMIPHVLDTIIYIEAGQVKRVLMLSLTVRTPTGMTEADLARPVVEVRNFESNNLEYEIYSYGEQTVIIPVKEEKESGLRRLAKKQIMDEIKRFDHSAEVEITSDDRVTVKVSNDIIPKIIGAKGKTVTELEKKIGMHIDIVPKVKTLGKEISFRSDETGAYIIFIVDERTGKVANFYSGEEFLFSATVGKNGQIRVSKYSEVGHAVIKGLLKGELKVFV